MQAISEVFMQDWDPIGVAEIPEAADEYDDYIGGAYRILAGTRSEDELVQFLYRTETEMMGLPGSSRERLLEVALKLLALDVRS